MAIPSLQSLCIDAIANTLLDSQAGTTFTGLDTLPVDITEKLQQILIQKNGLNDTTLLMTTSPQQTNLNVPFSMANDAPCISAGAALHAINKCASALKALSFSGHELTDALLNRITCEPLSSNLTSLSLVGCRVSLTAAQSILTFCTSLQHLNLNGNADITDDLFVPVQIHGKRSGHVYATRSSSSHGRVSSAKSHPISRPKRKRARSPATIRLKSVPPINSCDNSDPQSPLRAAGKMDLDLLSPELSHPSDPGFLDSWNSDPFSSESDTYEPYRKRRCLETMPAAQPTPRAFPFLQFLHLSGTSITNKSIEAISKLYPGLLELNVAHCSKVTDLTPIILRCPLLRYLDISGCRVNSYSDHLLTYAITQENGDVEYPFLQHLEILLFSGSGRLDAGFETWMKACGRTLLELRLANKTLPEDPIGQHIHARNARQQLASGMPLSDDQSKFLPLFVRLMLPCTRLEVLDLHGLNVTSSAMTMLFEVVRPAWTRTCVELDVVNCDEMCLSTLAVVFGLPASIINGEVEESQLSAFVETHPPTWPNLKSLSLSGGRHAETLSGIILPAIGTLACPQLEHLALNNARAGRALLRPVHVAQILRRFPCLRSVEIWCLSSVSFSLFTLIGQMCPHLTNVLLCLVGGHPMIGGVHPEHHLPARLQHAHQNGRPIEPNAVAVLAAAEAVILPPFLNSAEVKTLQQRHPLIEWKVWRHSVESARQFQHILPLAMAPRSHNSPSSSSSSSSSPSSHHHNGVEGMHTRRSPRRDDASNTSSTTVSGGEFDDACVTGAINESGLTPYLKPEQPTNQLTIHVEATGETDTSPPGRSRLIRANVLVDGVPIWNGEKSASMHHLTQSIWGLITHNAGAIPLVEDWCCACNIDEYNGVLFYDDSEYVYWDVLEPGPKSHFKFHKAQYVAAIAAATQQQWNIFKTILPKQELVQQALLFTQQHAWHQKLLDKTKDATRSPVAASALHPDTMMPLHPTEFHH